MKLHMANSVVRDIRRDPNRAGFDEGKVNGQWSDGISPTARNDQSATDRMVSGNLDMALLNALGGGSGGGSGGGQSGQQGAQQAEATAIHIEPESVQQARKALNDTRVHAGSVDTEWRDEALTALVTFLGSEGVASTEDPTIAALTRLGIDWRRGGAARMPDGSSTSSGGPGW